MEKSQWKQLPPNFGNCYHQNSLLKIVQHHSNDFFFLISTKWKKNKYHWKLLHWPLCQLICQNLISFRSFIFHPIDIILLCIHNCNPLSPAFQLLVTTTIWSHLSETLETEHCLRPDTSIQVFLSQNLLAWFYKKSVPQGLLSCTDTYMLPISGHFV